MRRSITLSLLFRPLVALGCLLLASRIDAGAQVLARPLTGFVDMHTHPRSDLAYGTQLFYGKPYGDMAAELKDCSSFHGSWGAKNKHGNVFRWKLAEETEHQYCKTWVDGKAGYPDFATWPSWCSILHQQMWVDWIARAHAGGLNVMVALTAHSHCIADAAETQGPYADEEVLVSSVAGIKDLVSHSDFMEVAYSPLDVRRIVGKGKLAVIIGVESDNIGNFYSPADHAKGDFDPNPSEQAIAAELDKLWDLGVRYMFPVHLTNNVFGGTAVYIPEFNIANKYNTGSEFMPEAVDTRSTGIAFDLTHPILTTNPEAEFLACMALRLAGGILPKQINPSRAENYTYWDSIPGSGHRNALGLTDKGRFAVTYMMQKGFLIDIDHMSDKMATAVLALAAERDYPVNSGHNGLRGPAGSEAQRTADQYRQIIGLGGMVGLGHCDYASNFVAQYRRVLVVTDHKNLAIGTDVNGFYPLPHPDTTITVAYDDDLSRCSAGNRTWDINVDGFAHYGLFPDYLRSWQAAGMTAAEQGVFMRSAEDFTVMWEKCEARKSALRP